MILFLSASFQERLALAWKQDLVALLIGDRNHYFYVPDSVVEVQSVSPETIDSFLAARELHGGTAQLLGFLSPGDLPPLPGYVFVRTGGVQEPAHWNAQVYMYADKPVLQARPVQIQAAAAQQQGGDLGRPERTDLERK